MKINKTILRILIIIALLLALMQIIFISGAPGDFNGFSFSTDTQTTAVNDVHWNGSDFHQ